MATGNFSPKVQNRIKKEITVSELNLTILTFSSGKLSFKLTIAAENSAYRRVIWKKEKDIWRKLKKSR